MAGAGSGTPATRCSRGRGPAPRSTSRPGRPAGRSGGPPAGTCRPRTVRDRAERGGDGRDSGKAHRPNSWRRPAASRGRGRPQSPRDEGPGPGAEGSTTRGPRLSELVVCSWGNGHRRVGRSVRNPIESHPSGGWSASDSSAIQKSIESLRELLLSPFAETWSRRSSEEGRFRRCDSLRWTHGRAGDRVPTSSTRRPSIVSMLIRHQRVESGLLQRMVRGGCVSLPRGDQTMGRRTDSGDPVRKSPKPGAWMVPARSAVASARLAKNPIQRVPPMMRGSGLASEPINFLQVLCQRSVAWFVQVGVRFLDHTRDRATWWPPAREGADPPKSRGGL